MWTCSNCGEQHEAQFAACWRCTTPNPTATAPDAVPPLPPQPEPLRCLRCPTTLEFVGTKKFHEGTRWGLLGELGELFVNRERFDFYLCPRCGRVEFFVDGIGEELRPQRPG